jgi:hypothetical protein
MVTVHTAQARLRGVHSLTALAGRAAVAPVARPGGRPSPGPGRGHGGLHRGRAPQRPAAPSQPEW